MKKLSVVIAAYDEEGNAEPLLRRLHAALAGMAGWRWEVVFVVEGHDRTREILERLAAELGGDVRVLYQPEPSGLGRAFRRGFAAVAPDADLVVTLDADLNHQPEEIPRLVAALEERRVDVLVGSRFVRGSTVEGTPLWKRFLSGVMNSLMRYLYGLRVLDKTSGFRVYRADVVRTVEYSNDRFAFLPELLIRIHQAGYRIAEEPIRFVFRRAGESKLNFWQTSFSYLALLRWRFDRLSLLALALVALGVAVRVAATFPLHKYPGDADALLTGLCADRVLRGETPVFFAPLRIGSLECHVAAPLIALLGPTRLALALVPLLLALPTLVIGHRFVRTLFGRRLACLALLFLAVPPPAVLFWTYMPNGYPTVLLLCVTILWLAARIGRDGPSPTSAGAFGLAVGLGFWHSFLTLGCTVPAMLWLALVRWRELARRPAAVAAMAGLALVGAAPWIAYNVRWGYPSLTSNFASQPAEGLGAVVDNARFAGRHLLPELVASTDPEGGVVGTTRWVVAAQVPLLVVYAAATVYFFLLPALRRRSAPRARGGLFGWSLLALVMATVFAMFVSSAAGQVRGLSVRYVLPLHLVAVVALALLVAAVSSWRRWAGVVVAALVVAFALGSYRHSWQPRRTRLTAMAAADALLLDRLDERGVGLTLGSFWMVYPLTFLSGERVIGLPCEPGHDHNRHGERLARTGIPATWGLVAATRARGALEQWVGAAGLDGDIEQVGDDYLLFVPRAVPAGSRPQVLSRTLAVCAGYSPLGP